MMLSRKRLLISLASGLGVLALAGGIVVATPRDADGLMPVDAVAVPVQADVRDASKEQHEERKHHVGSDPIGVAIGYIDRVDRAYDRVSARTEPESTPVTSSAPAPSTSGDTVWDDLAECEANGDWAINTGNGYYGGLQFSLSTWRSVGGSGYPHQASREEQIHRAEILRDINGGYGAWPSCSSQLGL
jgi:hypothetical protein